MENENIIKSIKEAFDLLSAADAIEEIEEILKDLEDVVSFGEARLRRLVRKIPELPQAQSPQWLIDQMTPLWEIGAFEHVNRLCKALIYKCPNYRATLEWASGGAVEVTWETNLVNLRWIVYQSPLPFPGVKVRVYWRVPGDRQLNAESFYFANSVIEHAVKVLEKDNE